MPRAPVQPSAQIVDAAEEEAPSKKIVRESNKRWSITDEEGRVITVQQLRILDHMRLRRALGKDLSENSSYRELAEYAASVVDIDGVEGPGKNNYLQIEHRMDWLGDNGFWAIRQEENRRIAEFNRTVEQEMDKEVDQNEKFRDDLKNS